MLDLNSLPLPRLLEELIRDGSLGRAVGAAIREDLKSPGDITSRSIISESHTVTATVVAREPGVIAGLELGPRIIGDQSLAFTPAIGDGESCKKGQTVATLTGGLRRMLGLERIILNFIGRLSGVATLTRQYVDEIKGTQAVICDTRKTTPGLRSLEKYAVRCGGGSLHRIGLYDAALYKDNHLAGIPIEQLGARLSDAIKSIRGRHEIRFVEVEADSLEQVDEILKLAPGMVDIILLDNMTPAKLRKAVSAREKAKSRVLLEASGGVTLKSVRAIAETGVDRISVGALTHSAQVLDLGLDIAQ